MTKSKQAARTEPGPGVRAERARRRRFFQLIGVCLALGAATGLLVGVYSGEDDAGPLPLWLALAASALWLAVMGYGAWHYETRADEVERNANYYGYAVGGGILLLVYPVWTLSWWAGAAPEPIHEALMAMLVIGALAGYVWKKYR